jgi:spermidine synthase
VLLVGAGWTVAAPDSCDVETTYHCASVADDAERPTGRTLVLDNLRHSYVDLSDPTHLKFAYVRAIATALDAHGRPGTPVRALHLGGGGYTIPRYLDATRPGSRSHVFEIDPGVSALAETRLGLVLGLGITTEARDARIGLTREASGSRDVVVGDAFGGVAVPWHLTTREAVRQVGRVLTEDGVYAVNVIDHPPLSFARAEVATIAAEFGHVAIAATRETFDAPTAATSSCWRRAHRSPSRPSRRHCRSGSPSGRCSPAQSAYVTSSATPAC